MAKRFFSENGIEFEDRSVENPKFRDELVEKYERMATPTIIIDDEIILGFGINKSKIMGKLNPERR
ncbi:MAG: glutaredoxin domain-containing protein [Candidatus Zixiibacteriota bacterium]